VEDVANIVKMLETGNLVVRLEGEVGLMRVVGAAGSGVVINYPELASTVII